jgi:hypothetical protein
MNPKHLLQLKTMIYEKLPDMLKRSGDSVALYRNLCEYLVKVAEKFHYVGVPKYKIIDYLPGKNGFLDLVWIDAKGKVILAVSVDGALRKRSIMQLKSMDVERKLFVYYGNSEMLKGFLENNDIEGEVSIVNLGHLRKDVRPRKKLKSQVSVFF